jgi:hypothetical protein
METFELTLQFKRVRRQLKFLRTRLGRIIRDIRRKIDGDALLELASARCSVKRSRCAARISISAVQRSMRYMPGGRVHRQW